MLEFRSNRIQIKHVFLHMCANFQEKILKLNFCSKSQTISLVMTYVKVFAWTPILIVPSPQKWFELLWGPKINHNSSEKTDRDSKNAISNNKSDCESTGKCTSDNKVWYRLIVFFDSARPLAEHKYVIL